MFLGIKPEGWLTIIAIVVGPLLAFAVQNWRDNRRERRTRKLDILRKLVMTLKVPLNPNHIDAINSIQVEFHDVKKVMDAFGLYILHVNQRAATGDLGRWLERKFDLLVDLVYEIAQDLGYSELTKAAIRDHTYVPQGHVDVETEWHNIRKAWLEVLGGKRPLPMTVVGTVEVEQPLPLIDEAPVVIQQRLETPPALPQPPVQDNGDNG